MHSFRGGIAVGHYFEYKDVTVSDALVRAHNIENTINPSLKRKYEWLFEYYNGKCVEKNQLKYIIEDKDIEELTSLNT